MPDREWVNRGIAGCEVIQRSGGRVATNEPDLLRHSQAIRELRTMPFEHDLETESVSRKQNTCEHPDAADLLRKCEQAINVGLFEAAEEYHAQFVEAATK